MKRTIQGIFVTTLILLSMFCGEGLKIATAESGGTYFQIGQSLASTGIDIEPVESAGTLENLQLLKAGKAQLAIVQADLWEDAAFSDTEVRQKIKLILPLYKEEIHLLAQQEITSLTSLQGKTISIGVQGSGTGATSRALLGFFGLHDNDVKLRNMNNSASINALKDKSLDAAFLIGGAPMKILTELNQPGLRLVAIDSAARQNVQRFLAYFKPATITGGTYDWQQASVSTLSVQSVIVGHTDLQKESVQALLAGVRKQRSELNKAHPKWRKVQLNYSDYAPSSVHPAVAGQ